MNLSSTPLTVSRISMHADSHTHASSTVFAYTDINAGVLSRAHVHTWLPPPHDELFTSLVNFWLPSTWLCFTGHTRAGAPSSHNTMNPSNDGSPGNAIDALLARYASAAHGKAAAGSEVSVHRQKFQLAASAKLGSAVQRGVNPFRLAVDALVGEQKARTRGKHQRAKQKVSASRRHAQTQQRRTSQQVTAKGTPTSLSNASAVVKKRADKRKKAAKKAPTPTTTRRKQGSHTKKQASMTAQGKKTVDRPHLFSTQTQRTRGGAEAVPLSVQSRHKELGLTQTTSQTSPKHHREAARAPTGQPCPTPTAATLPKAPSKGHTWVRPCTARHVRRALVGVGVPYALSHVARAELLSSSAADLTMRRKQERRQCRLVRNEIRHRARSLSITSTTTTTTTTAAAAAKTKSKQLRQPSRRERYRTLVSDTVALNDGLSWCLVARVLRERRRFLEPLNSHDAKDTTDITLARSFPLFGALVEVVHIQFNTQAVACATDAGLLPQLARQVRRRVGLVMAETRACVTVLLLPQDCQGDSAACQNVIETAANWSPADNKNGTPPPFDLVNVKKLFPGGSGDLLDVERHVLSTARSSPRAPRQNRCTAVCVYLGEVHPLDEKTSILACLKGRCL